MTIKSVAESVAQTKMWTLLVITLSTAIVCGSAEIGSYDYDNKIEETGSNDRDNLTSNVYVLPEQIFNDGKPFYVKKDSSGTFDFNAKTTPESLPTPTDTVSTQTNTYGAIPNKVNSTRKHDISLDNTVRTQNIHDYLNLPVKYQSSKFVYPLVSSSYANLKYQGNNKNYISNHKYDSSTIKSVSYTTKKFKPTYSPKMYTTAFVTKASTIDSFESTTKATPSTNNTRKYSNIPPRSSTPGRRYTPSPGRVSSTTVRNSLPTEFKHRGRSTTTTTTTTTTTQRPIEANGEIVVTPTILSVSSTVAPNQGKNVTESEKEPDSMNIDDFFSIFFNNDESEETDATRSTTKATLSTTVMTLRPAISTTTTTASTITKQPEHNKAPNNRYNMTLDSATRRPTNRTASAEFSTARPTGVNGDRIPMASTPSPVFAEYGDKTAQNTGKFRPPINMNNIRVSPNAQTASFVTNGQVSAGGFAGIYPYSEQNVYKGQFQPPAQSNMNNILVRPDSNSVSFVATGQLQTTTRLDQKPAPINDNARRPTVNQNKIDETTKPGVTFISKGQVTSAEVYDNPNQNKVVFSGPSANANNIVIAPGTHTAAFVTSSHVAMGGDQSATKDHQIKNVENEINAYGSGLHASQRPHGFQLPSTTAIPPKAPNAQSIQNETQQHIRFPTENAQNAEKQAASVVQPETTSFTSGNNTIKFPSNHQMVQTVPQVIQHIPQAIVQDGLVKFTDIRNEIVEGIDPNNYKQIIQNPNLGGGNLVVFRPQPPIALPQPPLPPLIMPIVRTPQFVFKKPTFIHYPRKNYTLPNILPQFRPTPPQQQIAINPEIANQLRQGQLNRAQYMFNAQNLRYKAPMQYLYAQRPIQIRPSIDQTQNRRHFELHPGNFNRIYDRPIMPHVYNRAAAIGSNALLIEPQRFDENMKVPAPAIDMDSSKNLDFENGDAKLISVQSIVESQKEIPKVEPVTTLQMIQQQRLLQKTGAVAINGLSTTKNATTSSSDTNGKTEKPLYVVYPMQKAATLNGGNHGNGEIATILADQTHKPATIQQLGLPYTLDKHKSRYILNSRPAYEMEKKSDQQEPIAAETDEEDSDRPIAIAYSPTEPNPSHLADVYRPTPAHHHSAAVFANAPNVPNVPTAPNVVPNVPNVANYPGVPEEAVNANQQFQAPFIPSINLENTQSTHNGWLIVTPPTILSGSNTNSKSNRISASLSNANATSISRSDSGEIVESDASVEKTTKKFDIDSFMPDFQGGFVPIYKNSGGVASESKESVKSKVAVKADEKSDRSDLTLESLIYDGDDDDDDDEEEE